MTHDTAIDSFETYDRIFLEKLRLAADVILRLGEDDDGISEILESELYLFRDRVERAFLTKPSSSAAESGT